jgi:exodeoxyribonuclease V gamma subunit
VKAKKIARSERSAASAAAYPLELYRSNRMERLVDALAELVAQPTDDAFAPECILVSGRGVAHWLSLELSRRFGVWANSLYLFPRNFVHWALERFASSEGEAAADSEVRELDREQLSWAVLATLSGLLEAPELAILREYVAGDETGVRYFELCQQIATTFDQYRTYRPELIHEWEKQRAVLGDGKAPQLPLFEAQDAAQRWQPMLWRALSARLGGQGESIEQRFFEGLAASQRAGLPSRIISLGVDNLPPLYTRILVGLCAHVPVYSFQLAASELGWQSVELTLPERTRGASRSRTQRGGKVLRLAPRPAHPLVRSLGMLGGEFEALLRHELTRQGIALREPRELFQEPPRTTLLSRLQGAILASSEAAARAPDAPHDDSIAIHVCHSPMREVEVLHDQLLALLAHGQGVAPEDVVVMMPDVNDYAPLIEAVFQRDHQDGYRIPYSIADRSIRDAAPVVDALARILELVGTRLNAPQILDLLALEVVAQRFDILPQDVEKLTRWVSLANIRWGMDAEHHQREGHPYAEANSWRFGLRRLLMGYAVSNSNAEVFGDTLPLEAVEGIAAGLLGKLCEFLDRLFSHLLAFLEPRTPQGWQDSVSAALEDLLHNDPDNAWQHQELRTALGEIAERARSADFEGTLTHQAFTRLLLDTANDARPARGFLAKGVTFCSMVPLRSIPFRVIAMLGLGDGEFPRREHFADFDLIAHSPDERRLGDRSRRNEDRYLFLEALLSARERLIITYTGQSIRDNAEMPPSVVVSELVDCLRRQGASLEQLIVKHPLQAFSQRYFDGADTRLFSYEEYYKKAAESLGEERASLVPLFPEPLPPPASGEPYELGELVRFFENPTAYLLNNRVGVWLTDKDQLVASREPQELSALDKYGVGNQLLELLLADVPEERLGRMIRASGAVPWGTPGDLYLIELTAAAQPIAAAVRKAQQGGRQPLLPIHQPLPGERVLTGAVTQRFGDDVVHHQFARVRARHLLRLWINHLAHCLGRAAEAASPKALLIGRPEPPSDRSKRENERAVARYGFRTVKDPAAELARLCAIYDEGLCRPLSFYPSASLIYMQGLGESDQAKARDQATKALEDEVKYDAHLTRVLGSQPASLLTRQGPDVAAFKALAEAVYQPLLAHLESL